MKLLEHEAKQLLKESGIPIPTGTLVTKTTKLHFPAVLKSQVPTGGRGKAGGIIVVNDQNEATNGIKKLLSLRIKGFLPTTVLAEEKLLIKKELYLSILINRQSSSIQLVAHKDGGIEVEENTNFKSWNVHNHTSEALGQELAEYYEIIEQTFALQDMVENLKTCFVTNDALLIEINPLIITTDNELIAGDCKITLDDAAAFRHEWNFEEKQTEANFVTLEQNGNIATIANGAGLAMATVDAAYEAGLVPANFLDIGGGANEATLLEAFHHIVTYKNVQAIVINIFAGITRADEVARAIVSAKEKITQLPPLFIRLAGTNYDAASEILTAHNIVIMPNLDSCLQAAKKVVHA